MAQRLRWLRAALSAAVLLPVWVAALVAQEPGAARIAGRVTDDNGAGLPAATVAIPELGIGATAGADGAYSLVVPAARVQNQQVTLTARAIGYKPTSATLTLSGGAAAQDFSLPANPLQLGEIVVTGAGTVSETEKLPSVRNNVSGEEIRRANEPNVVQALAAQAPNVNVTQSGGEPGASSYITIRGQRTIGLPGSGAAQPLFVVDGVPIDNSSFSTTDFNTLDGLTAGEIEGTTQTNRASDINPNDVESVEILKGPAAAAIYGARAGQGVILITTKKGTPGQTRYSLRTQLSADDINHTYPLQTRFGQGRNNTAPALGDCDQAGNLATCLRSWGPDVQSLGAPVFNHSDEAYRTGFSADNTLTVSGGTDRTLFFLSGEYFHNNGIFSGPNNSYSRTAVRLNGSHRMTDNLKVGANIGYTDTRGSFIQRGNNTNGLQLGLLRTPPNFDNRTYLDLQGFHRSYVYQNPAAGDERGDRFFANPFFVLNEFTDEAQAARVIGNVDADWVPAPWLSFNYTLGADYSNDERLEGQPPGSTASGTLGRVTEGKIVNYQINHNLTATGRHTFNRNFGGSLTLGQNLNVRNNRQLGTVGRTLIVADPVKLQGTVQRDPPIDDESNIHTESYFGQATLDLYDQIFLTAALRNDGSSTYSQNNRRSWFPKAGAAWEFTKAIGERPWLTFGKVRFAYGEAGQEPSPYLTSNTFSSTTTLSGITQGTGLLPVQNGLPGVVSSLLLGANDLKEERSKEWEAGFDLGLLRDRADLSFTYYHTISEDVILLQPLAPSTGFFRTASNAAKFRNAGAEVSLNLRPITSNDFAWDVGLQWGKNKGRVLDLGGADFVVFDPNSITPQGVAQQGEEIGVLRDLGFVRCGISSNTAIPGVDLAQACSGAPTGAYYLDEDGLPVGDSDPRIIANPNPDWTGSVRTGLRIKGVSFSGLLDVRHGGDIYNGTRGALWSYGTHKDTEVRATCTGATLDTCSGNEKVLGTDEVPGFPTGPVVGPGAGKPVPIGEYYYRNVAACPFTGNSENCIEDGGFVKLREISVGYSLAQPWVRRALGFSSIDLRVAGRNLKTWTDYTGYDPETNLGGAIQATRGIDYFLMPQTRSFLFSVTLNR